MGRSRSKPSPTPRPTPPPSLRPTPAPTLRPTPPPTLRPSLFQQHDSDGNGYLNLIDSDGISDAHINPIDIDRELPALNGPNLYFEMSSTQFYGAVFLILALIMMNIFCLAMTHIKACQKLKRKHLKMVGVSGLDSADDCQNANDKEKANLLVKQFHIT
eukprot:407186_1